MKKNLLFGVFLVIIGFLCLVMALRPVFWPIAFCLVGAWLMYRGFAGGKAKQSLKKRRQLYQENVSATIAKME